MPTFAFTPPPADPADRDPGTLYVDTPPARPEPVPGSDPGLTPAPPLRVSNGRVYFGPLQIPGVHIPPLY